MRWRLKRLVCTTTRLLRSYSVKSDPHASDRLADNLDEISDFRSSQIVIGTEQEPPRVEEAPSWKSLKVLSL